jgi:hypothetical protein
MSLAENFDSLEKDRRLLTFILANDVLTNKIILDSKLAEVDNKFFSIFETILPMINSLSIMEIYTLKVFRNDKNYSTVEDLINTSKLINC